MQLRLDDALVHVLDGVYPAVVVMVVHDDQDALHKALDAAEADYKAGATDARKAVAKMSRALAKSCDRTDYVVAVDADTLDPVKTLGPNTLLAVAAYVGKTRLIDNHLL